MRGNKKNSSDGFNHKFNVRGHVIYEKIVYICISWFFSPTTTAASGTSHWKFENVHKPTMLKLAIPGSISGFIGAGLLTQIHGDYIKPYIALFLLSMGIYILYQFLFKRNREIHTHVGKLSGFKLVPQGAIAGFLDAIGGGGWGPVNTPLLLASHKIQPRYAIGTVSASEFFVTLSTSLSFIIFLGITQINWWFVIALSVGGMIAAPISAYLTKILPINILAICKIRNYLCDCDTCYYHCDSQQKIVFFLKIKPSKLI